MNRAWLGLGLKLILARTGIDVGLLWTYSPLTAELYDLRRFSSCHSTTRWTTSRPRPGMPASIIASAEPKLVRRADLVATTSPGLRDRHAASGAKRCVFMPNVADAEHFAAALAPDVAVPADLVALPAPRIGFVGAVSGYKLDFELIRGLALVRPGYSFVLIGQVGEGDPWTDASRLSGLPNLHLLGPRPYSALPAYLAGMQAAMLPSAANPYTAAMFPMKFFEYLAAGLPVVTTPLPALGRVRRARLGGVARCAHVC